LIQGRVIRLVKVRDKKETGNRQVKGAEKVNRVRGAKPGDRPSFEKKKVNTGEANFVKPQKAVPKDITEDIPRLEGRNPVIEALKSGRTIEKLYVAKGAREGSIRQIIAMARDKGIVVNEVDRLKLDSMSETRSHQGVIAVVSSYAYVEIDDILANAKEKGEQPFIIILDEIYDPNNLGSVLRTANACGVHGVIISKRRAVGLTPAVAKASAGAVEYMKVSKVTNITQAIKYLKDNGVWIVGADMDGEKVYFEADFTGPVALVIGSEGEGLGKLVKDNCDFVVRIPMKGEISSLNAAVAGAVLMYDAVRQRILKK
jgi:23S rRNA (guanosine2251-2'-O)-methyltransferase